MSTPMQPNVALRALEPEDLELLYTIENDPGLWQVGTSNVPYSRYSLRQFIAGTQNDIYADGQLRLVVTCDDRAVGLLDLTAFSPRHLRAEVGIALLRSHQGQGIGALCLQRLEDYVRQTLRLRLLYAQVSTANRAAVALFAKAGYTAVATLPEWLVDGEKTQDVALFSKKIEKSPRNIWP